MNDKNKLASWQHQGEEVVWKGYPLPGRLFTLNDLYFIPFSVAFLWSVWDTYRTSGLTSFLMIWSAIVFYLVAGRYLHKYFRKKSITYYLTTKRVIIYDTKRGNILQELEYSMVKKITKNIGRNGVGDLLFGTPTIKQMFGGDTGFDMDRRPNWFEPTGPTPAFYGIENCEEVYKLVCELRDTAINA